LGRQLGVGGCKLGRLEGGWGGRAERVSACQAGGFAATKVVRAMQQPRKLTRGVPRQLPGVAQKSRAAEGKLAAVHNRTQRHAKHRHLQRQRSPPADRPGPAICWDACGRRPPPPRWFCDQWQFLHRQWPPTPGAGGCCSWWPYYVRRRQSWCAATRASRSAAARPPRYNSTAGTDGCARTPGRHRAARADLLSWRERKASRSCKTSCASVPRQVPPAA